MRQQIKTVSDPVSFSLGGALGRAAPYIGGLLMLLDVALGPSDYELWQEEQARKFWRDYPPC